MTANRRANADKPHMDTAMTIKKIAAIHNRLQKKMDAGWTEIAIATALEVRFETLKEAAGKIRRLKQLCEARACRAKEPTDESIDDWLSRRKEAREIAELLEREIAEQG